MLHRYPKYDKLTICRAIRFFNFFVDFFISGIALARIAGVTGSREFSRGSLGWYESRDQFFALRSSQCRLTLVSLRC